MIPDMISPWHLGNDIVDLADPRHPGKAKDERFLRRVFSEREQEAIRSSVDPDRALWTRWAGKEAAFKTVSKSLGVPPTFVHPRFEVTVFEPGAALPSLGRVSDPPMTRFGEVRYERLILPLRVETQRQALHAVTWVPSPNGQPPSFSWGSRTVPSRDRSWRETLRPELSPLEWDCVSHQASALARLAARQSMAAAFGVDEKGLEVGCGPGEPGRRIPRVFLQGELFGVDLTLSHHGRLLAWAFLHPDLPEGSAFPQSQGL